MRRARIMLFSIALVLPIAVLTRAPYTPPGNADAHIRFSWRMSIAARESCRPRTQEELDRLPVHMRTPEECTRDGAGYALITRMDNTAADTIVLVRGGVKGDRPLFVLEDGTLPPGQHRIRVDLERMTDSGTTILASLDTVLTLRAGMIQLITLDPEARHLTAR